MAVTLEQLESFFENTDQELLAGLVDPINAALDRYEINTPERVAMFMAQVGHESGGLKRREENLNYSAQRLSQVFPRYFRDVDPNDYARNPEAIANRVYGNRMGNGDEDSGDGYRYRGRGFIQLTGKNNYQAFANAMGMSLDEAVDYLSTAEGAAMSAAWFWDMRNINPDADRGDVVTVTKKINGGTIGLAERKDLYQEALSIF